MRVHLYFDQFSFFADVDPTPIVYSLSKPTKKGTDWIYMLDPRFFGFSADNKLSSNPFQSFLDLSSTKHSQGKSFSLKIRHISIFVCELAKADLNVALMEEKMTSSFKTL